MLRFTWRKFLSCNSADRLLVLVQRLLPLQPHVLVELLNERLYSSIQLVLAQRGFPTELHVTRGRTQRLVASGMVVEGLGFLHPRRGRGILVSLTLARVPRVGFFQVVRQWHGAAVSDRLPRAFQRVVALWLCL